MFDLCIEMDGHRTQVVVRPGALGESGALLHGALESEPAPLVVVVSDKTVGPLCGKTVTHALARAGFRTHEVWVGPGEPSKSLATLEQVYRALLDGGASRDAVVAALGGGVVSDLAGFAAATWMRGIRFAIFPTTLEADLDASIGGKTAINIPGGKNLVGAFHPPCLVVIDPLCLRTLDERDIRAGLAESIKHALISSAEFLTWHEERAEAVLSLDARITTELILRNVRCKAEVVRRDVYERTGARMVLNFGHTIGHAIEECSGYTLRHGECVSLGMTAACRLSRALGLIDTAAVERVERLLQRFGLPIVLATAIDTDRIIETIGHDKKARGGKVRFVLLEAIGRTLIRDDIPTALVRQAFESLRP